MKQVGNIVTRKIGLIVGFSEVPQVTERCENLEQCLLSDLGFIRKDVLMYRDLSRKNIVKLIDDLANVFKTNADADEQQLIFFYFAANWDASQGDLILNQSFNEQTNVTLRLQHVADKFPNCLVI